MRRFKIVTISFLILLGALFFFFFITTQEGSEGTYPAFSALFYGSTEGGAALTQQKQNVERSYWFFSDKKRRTIKVYYPSSKTFQEESLIEEIVDFSASVVDGPFYSLLTAATGRLDYRKNTLTVVGAHLDRYKHGKKICSASAQSVILDLKESIPTFIATDLKAEMK